MLGHSDSLNHAPHHRKPFISPFQKIDHDLEPFKQWKKMDEGARRCRKPSCQWVGLVDLTEIRDVPILRPNPELSGVGVLLGFSITAYLTLTLLVLHYLTVHECHRTNSKGKGYTNPVDRAILGAIRERIFSWRPSRRFQYAMEKAVLILSDTQLVSGLAFLIGGYSQVNCLSAYHWQMMVYVAWFSSFSFLSSMTFLEDYFQTNHSMRIIRVFFMTTLGTFLIVALLPTGSHNWLNLLPGEGGFYPSLEAGCFFAQMGTDSFDYRGSPKIWSMVMSVLVVAISYIHSGIRLFDPTAEFTRKTFRTRPGVYIKRVLHYLEEKACRRGVRAALWTVPYLMLFAAFTSLRALFDIMESMLLEIIWLTFAMTWGSIKLWDTRALLSFDVNGRLSNANSDVLEEDYWSFGQILPLVLLLLPLLAMLQTYLDNDAKLADAVFRAYIAEKMAKERDVSATQPEEVAKIRDGDEQRSINEPAPDPQSSASCSIRSCSHASETASIHPPLKYHDKLPMPQPLVPSCSPSREMGNSDNPPDHVSNRPQLPQHPYYSFVGYSWYTDHIVLLIFQIVVFVIFLLWLLTQVSSIFGISDMLRHRIFILWLLAVIPAASIIHLGVWYAAGWAMKATGIEAWFIETKLVSDLEARKSKRILVACRFLLLLRMCFIIGLVVFTFFLSIDVAGPNPIALRN